MSSACHSGFQTEIASPQLFVKGSLSAIALLLGLLLAGCNTSGLYPVTGVVVDDSGQPIAGIADSNYVMFAQVPDGLSSSMGDIRSDGSFTLFTNRPGDGVPPGDYHVYLPRKHLDPEHAAPQVIAGKFESIEHSGWTKTVEKKANHFELQVTTVRKAPASQRGVAPNR